MDKVVVLRSLVAVTLLALPLATLSGCSHHACEDLEAECDLCQGTDYSGCHSELEHCRMGMDVGPMAYDEEDDCCEEILEDYDPRC